jgi:hypothetical protein
MYVKTKNLTVELYPYSISQLKSDNPTVSFVSTPSDAMLAEYSVYPVTTPRPPEYNIDIEDIVLSDIPVLLDGVWVKTWTIISKSEEEVASILADNHMSASISMRTERNRLLAETDFFALSDVNMPGEITTYRQALRDLPETVDINNIIYPEKP